MIPLSDDILAKLTCRSLENIFVFKIRDKSNPLTEQSERHSSISARCDLALSFVRQTETTNAGDDPEHERSKQSKYHVVRILFNVLSKWRTERDFTEPYAYKSNFTIRGIYI